MSMKKVLSTICVALIAVSVLSCDRYEDGRPQKSVIKEFNNMYAKKNMINTCVPLAFPPSAIKAVITGPKYQKNFNELEMALEVLGYKVSDISILESTSGYR